MIDDRKAVPRTELRLRKVRGHPQATDAYRVFYNEISVGSISLQVSARQRQFWQWALDTVLPRQAFSTSGEATTREDAMQQFKATWEAFASDPERLEQFLTRGRARRLEP